MDSVMAFSSIFKKATNLLGFGGCDLKPPPLDGEIIYCKNNVCVHPPAPLTMDSEHHPGYLNIRSQMDKTRGPTLILTWIPNSSLKKNPRSIENSPNKTDEALMRPSPRRQARPEFTKVNTPSPASSPRGSTVSANSELYEYYLDKGPVRTKKKHSLDNSSINSELSVGSRDDFLSGESWGQNEEASRKLSMSNKSQTDSGLGPEDLIQNNEKNFKGEYQRMTKIGVNVNNLQTSKGNNCVNAQNKGTEDELSSPDTSDSLTAEEQLAAMLKRNKLRAKVKENAGPHKSVSIEMEGDNLVIVTEEVDKDSMAEHNIYCEERNINKNESKFDSSSSISQSTDGEGISLSSDSTHPSPSGAHYNQMLTELKESVHKNVTENGHCDHLFECDESSLQNGSSENVPHERSKVPSDLNYRQKTEVDINGQSVTTPDISITRFRTLSERSSSTTTSGPDSNPPSLSSSPDNYPSFDQNMIESPSSCDSSVYSHNLTFPHNSLTYSQGKGHRKKEKDHICGVFSVDLGQMRSLRLFYSDPECTRGQVVIASRESQYKILHFHTGGLDKLAEIFNDWNLFAQDQHKRSKESHPYKQFLIVRPKLTDDQCHPEEGVYCQVDDEMWKRHMNVDGQIEEDYQLRKNIFFGGLDPGLRHETWPFLLHYYPYDSTFDDREQLRNDRYIEYHDIRKQRESMTAEEQEQFWRRIQSTVEKDVIRTDRSHEYFKGEDNPNIEVLQNILLNYAVANPHLGYTQGMSDLLAPVLAEIQNEADAYWCFVGLMQRTLFVSSPKDNDMDIQLNYLKELLRIMQSDFYYHLYRLGEDAMELLFCHRWILLCFKREFPEVDALKIWEACWSHYQTDYFHLFICVAIVSIYGDDVIDQGLPSDEILLHFSSLAMHMNGDLVLRKARGLLHDFRQIPKIPCTLHGLCALCGPGMWDSGHVPMVECVGNHGDNICPYHSNPTSPTHSNHSFS